MYLKRLDVSGFKSFADKTSIEFVPGVTAVVGPNGSGKSNITEAIRWVLGEQSAKSLRGTKMEDIIFSGSDARKAVNLADVTLILDNSDHYLNLDFSELSVTRRVFRSGESEFLINGQSCRLKDIVDLFLDSGLGKEAYSVIGQGKIDEILNSKAEDKRRIFEEASGVLKYKLRKQAAEKQLDDAEDNLSRVEDILHELESRLEPLKEQASLAKEYLEKKEELKQVDVGLLAYDIERMHADWTASKTEAARLEKERVALEQEISAEESAFSSNRQALQELEQKIDSLQNAWAMYGEQLEKLLGQKEVLAERKRHAETTSEELKDRLTSVAQQLQEAQKALQEAERAYKSENSRMKALNTDLSEKEAAFGGFAQNLEARLNELNSQYVEILNQQAALHNEQHYLSEQDKAIEEKRRRSAANTDAVHRTLRKAQEEREKTESNLAQASERRDQLKTQFAVQKNMLEKDKKRYDQQKAAIEKIDRLSDQAISRKEMLEALQEDYAGFYQGVKEVLKHKEKLQGVHGAVAELIRVDRRYQLAIETALGAAAQSVIVADETAGRQAIRFLCERQAGRATFLPMAVIKGRSLGAAERQLIIEQRDSLVGLADQLIQCEARYRPILAHLLGTTVIAQSLAGANQLAKILHYRYRIVTLEGDVVSPGGAMTGGSVKTNRSSVLSRTTEIESLKQQIDEMRAKSSELKQSFSALKARIASEEMETAKMGQALAAAEDAYRNLEVLCSQSRAEEKNSADKFQLLSRENSDFVKEQQAIQNRLKVIAAELQNKQEQEQQSSQEIARFSSLRKNREAAKDALQEEITALKVQAAHQSQVTLHLKEKMHESAEKAADLKATLAALQLSMADVDETLGGHELSAEDLDRRAQTVKGEKESAADELEKAKALRRNKQELLSKGEAELSDARRRMNQLTSALEHENVSLNRLDVALDHLIDTLREEYELTVAAAKEQFPLTLEPDEARKKVKLIKRSIDELGTVNLGAIEEYQQVSEREHFLSEQREDLLRARANLENVMTEMDQEVCQRFSKTFGQIRNHFRTVFAELFGGGQADLKLIDPDDLLNSGIDILAEPPGKKLQKLSLLSGGERALTAIALLFAILKVRPVPFCVLDEVEAALDDANVDRYAEFLKKFSSETQFIVVTHRHGTMEHADVLYGVTMQESGISRLVSVRLEETEELLQAGG